MPRSGPFDALTDRYEGWFEDNEAAYRSEVHALERFVDADSFGIEIGVGSGQFAVPLDIDVGVDPSRAMLHRARARDVEVVQGVAEKLPFDADTFDVALIVTAICFVDDVEQTLAEAERVLRPGGRIVLGYIDAESPVGQVYQEHKASNPFYREATFVTTTELLESVERAGFERVQTVQTIFEFPTEMEDPAPVESGYGDGSFVALAATTPA